MKRRCLLMGLAVVLLVGCRTNHTHQAGDAIVHEQRIHFSLMATAPVFYRVELPKVSLAEVESHRFAVRNSPAPPLSHLFMSLPQGDCMAEDKKSSATLPWERAVVTLVVTEPDGGLIYSNRFCLGDLKWRFSKCDLKLKPWNHAGRIFGWFGWSDLPELKNALETKTDYDAIISVERASARKRDFIQLRGEEAGSWPSSQK